MTSDEPGAGADGDGEVEELRHTVEELRDENEQLRQSKPDAPERGSRWRRAGTWVLLVVACILAVVSVLVVFVRNEVLDSDAYVSTVGPLASSPPIQKAVATKISHRLVTQTDLQQRVENALPSKAGFLAAPITSGVQSATYDVTLKVVQSDRFQSFWVNANRRAHGEVVGLLTGSNQKALQAQNGEVVLDLSQVQTQVKQALDARGITVFDKVPNKGTTLVLFRSDQLRKLQRLVRFLNHLAIVLPILTLLAFVGVVLLTKNRRRGLVRATTGLAVSMALILVVAAVLRNQYLSSLRPDQPKDAAAAFLDAVSAVLLDSVRTILIISLIVALGSVAAGNRWLRSWLAARRWPSWLTEGPVPTFVVVHRTGLQWATAGLALFVLVVWSKPSTFVVIVVLLVALAVIAALAAYASRHRALRAPASSPAEP